VVTVQPSDDAAQSSAPPAAPPTPASAPNSGHPGNGFLETSTPAAAFAPVAPPPPPADALPAAPKTVALGQTKDQVVAILGQPQKVASLGAKEIDYYSDMKVVFIKGKVTDIQ
jgi:hypothetical protein